MHEIVIKKSRFIATLVPVRSIGEADVEIAALRNRYGLTKMTKVVVGGMTRAEWRRWVAANPDAVATAPADRVVPAELGDAVVGSAAVEAVEVPAETVAAVDEV